MILLCQIFRLAIVFEKIVLKLTLIKYQLWKHGLSLEISNHYVTFFLGIHCLQQAVCQRWCQNSKTPEWFISRLPNKQNCHEVIDRKKAVLYRDIVIAYASRGLRPNDYNYPAHKLEFLCLKWALCDQFLRLSTCIW